MRTGSVVSAEVLRDAMPALGIRQVTQAQLDAGADAVAALAAKYGYSAYISRDQQREIAAAVINAYLRATALP